jgi:hypothetical protein
MCAFLNDSTGYNQSICRNNMKEFKAGLAKLKREESTRY